MKYQTFHFRTKAAAERAHAILHHALSTIMDEDGLTLAQIRMALKMGTPVNGLLYTHVDTAGMRWRMVGLRPVSELADEVMKKSGLKPL